MLALLSPLVIPFSMGPMKFQLPMGMPNGCASYCNYVFASICVVLRRQFANTKPVSDPVSSQISKLRHHQPWKEEAVLLDFLRKPTVKLVCDARSSNCNTS